MYLYFSILNSDDEEIFSNEEQKYTSKKRKKDHFRNDTNTQCKIIFINDFMMFLLVLYIDILHYSDNAISRNKRQCVNDSSVSSVAR